MTDPTATRSEVEAQRRAVSFLRSQHAQICFERGDHKDEVDTPWSRGADAIEQCAALRERAEAAERHKDAGWDQQRYWSDRYISKTTALEAALVKAQAAEAAAWNDAIEAAAQKCRENSMSSMAGEKAIRALRRDVPTEGEA